MLSFLKNHPFGVEAYFDFSLVLTFAVPKETLEGLIPPCLTLDMLDDKWAFVAVAMVQTRALRPKGFPRILGNDFFLIGYRIFTRYTSSADKRLRGLYILRSDTNKRKMQFLGNIFTHYTYTTTDISTVVQGTRMNIHSVGSQFEVIIDAGDKEVEMPVGSPFRDWKEARRFAGPLPFTFFYNAPAREVTIIEGRRENWYPEPVRVMSHEFAFLKGLGCEEAIMANAFMIRNIPYHWGKGKVEKWNG